MPVHRHPCAISLRRCVQSCAALLLSTLLLCIAPLLLAGCQDEVQGVRRPYERGSLFQYSDRVLLDDDSDPRCFDPVDGSNNNLAGLLTRSLRQEISEVDGRVDPADARATLAAIGNRQPGVPFDDSPLRGGDLCSPVSKLIAGGYYDATGMPPTMGGWCERYGLAPDCQTGGLETILAAEDAPRDLQVSYFNAHALPVFRITLCNQQPGPGFACVNLNFVCPERLPGGIRIDESGTPLPLPVSEALCDPVDAGCNQCEAVSVTMHYDVPRDAAGDPVPGAEPMVIFGAYRGVGPDAPLMDRIDLDFSGVEDPHETIPNICNDCHGGQAYAPLDARSPTLDELDMQAQFLPINPRYALRDKAELFAFLDEGLAFDEALMRVEPATALQALQTVLGRADGAVEFFGVSGAQRADGQRLFDTRLVGDLQVVPGQPARLDISGDLADTRAINRLILTTDPLPGNATVLAATIADLDRLLDGGEAYPELHRQAELPPDWAAAGVDPADFRLVAEHCTDSCHISLVGEVDFQQFDAFVEYRESTFFDLCRDYAMPQSPESFNLFWSKSDRVGEASRGDDVEALLTRAIGPGWAPLLTARELDVECPIPPLVFGAALAQPEFTSPQVLRGKARACRAELAAEGGAADIETPRLRNCRAICADVVLDSGFEQSAAITGATCDALVTEGLIGVDTARLEELREIRRAAGREAWAVDVATPR